MIRQYCRENDKSGAETAEMCYMRVCSGVPVSRVLGPEIESILKLQENKSSNLPTNLFSTNAWNLALISKQFLNEKILDVCLETLEWWFGACLTCG